MPVKNLTSGMDNMVQMPVDKAARLMLGVDDYTILHAANGDQEVMDEWRNCRAIKVDVEGIVRIKYIDDFGGQHIEVAYIPAGIFLQYRNVVKLYKFYLSTPTPTQGTTGCYKGDGGLISNAIKIYR